REEVTRLGLRNKNGKPLSINGLSVLLKNRFYVGVIPINKTGETFRGIHTPIVTAVLFERAQDVLQGRCAPKTKKHFFLFRRMLRCAHCGYTMSGELQKGRVYYSCHTPGCLTTGIREDQIERQIATRFRDVELTQEEASAVESEVIKVSASSIQERDALLH